MRQEDIDAAATLVDACHAPLPFTPTFRALGERRRDVVAVDGSHAVLVDNGIVWSVAVRAAALAWPGPRIDPVPHVTTVLANDAEGHLESEYQKRGLDAPRAGTAEAFAEALRALAEADAARAPKDALLLLDGAIEGVPPKAAAVWAPVLESRAVLAVSKRSALGDAWVPAYHALGPEGPWIADVPGMEAHIVKLHARAPFAYRVDGPEEHVEALVPLARDAAYLGYPYPLAKVHHCVAITADIRAQLRERLLAGLRKKVGAKVRLLDDPHAMLD